MIRLEGYVTRYSWSSADIVRSWWMVEEWVSGTRNRYDDVEDWEPVKVEGGYLCISMNDPLTCFTE